MLSIEEVINRLLLDKDVMYDAVHYLQSYQAYTVVYLFLLGNFAETDKLLYKLEALKEAYNVWQDKTEWVQKTCKPSELGYHRADVLRMRIEALEAELMALKAATT